MPESKLYILLHSLNKITKSSRSHEVRFHNLKKYLIKLRKTEDTFMLNSRKHRGFAAICPAETINGGLLDLRGITNIRNYCEPFEMTQSDEMNEPQRYVLVLDSTYEDFQGIRSMLSHLHCPVFIAGSAEQAVAQAQQIPPYLVILAGSLECWSKSLVNQLRQITHKSHVIIVALTETANPRWEHYDENPGIDGFLVKPVSGDVLHLLIESASAKQT